MERHAIRRGMAWARGEARVAKNILIFSDGTGQAGGYMPDETRSNVYKLLSRHPRLARTPRIDPKHQVAFYDGGLGSRASGEGIKIKWWRRIYNLLGQATGLGITQNIIDCYAEIIRVWQPGDRIYLFGFSRGAYTVRCVAGVLKYCGVPTAVHCEHTGKTRRAAARSQVGAPHRHRGRQAGLPVRQLGQARSLSQGARGPRPPLPRQVLLAATPTSPTPRPISSACGTPSARWAPARSCSPCSPASTWRRCGVGALLTHARSGGISGRPSPAMTLDVPAALYLAHVRALPGPRQPRPLPHGVLRHQARTTRCAMRAMRSPSTRTARKFSCVPWEEDQIKDRAGADPPRFKQVWFAGSHSDIGGSYPETESRLSDITLAWMVEEALGLPEPILIDRSVLQLYPDSAGAQHDERKAFMAACPGWLVRLALLFVHARNFGWREGHRRIPERRHAAPLRAAAVPARRRHGARRHGALPAAGA